MKLPLDRSVLVDMGLGALSDADLDSLLVALIGSLELSVGNTLAARLTDAEMVELDSLKGAAAAAWLDAHAPGYREVVAYQYREHLIALRMRVPRILAECQDPRGD